MGEQSVLISDFHNKMAHLKTQVLNEKMKSEAELHSSQQALEKLNQALLEKESVIQVHIFLLFVIAKF